MIIIDDYEINYSSSSKDHNIICSINQGHIMFVLIKVGTSRRQVRVPIP